MNILAQLEDRPTWMAHADCRDLDPRLFYPVRGQPTGPAKQVCQACPVRQACLEYALANREKHGIWGGTTVRDRRHILRQQRTKRAA